MIVVALHGFFGTPDDWRLALKSLDSRLGIDLVTPDLGVWATRSNITDFETFSAALNRSVRILLAERPEGERAVIAGYSLGARLGAYCLLDEPEMYSGALFLSMNPGIKAGDFQARRDRVTFDAEWSERMRRDPWEKTWTAWNEQPVLKPGTRATLRGGSSAVDESEESIRIRKLEGRREAWARAMDIWTLGLQADLRNDLASWAKTGDNRLTLMTGTEDGKFSELTADWMKSLTSDAQRLRHRLVLGAGHRVLMEASEDVVSELSSLLTRA